MSGSGFLLLALLLLGTVEATKVEQEKKGMQTDQLIKFYDPLPRLGRQNMQSPLFSERLRTRALGFRQLSSQKQ
uniref:Conorfamide protein n=1 Tax=Conus ebraeus TaxID=89425 RepID=A0AA50LTJ3_CONEA|nr:hormone conorfamide [Conus ebraeus]UMA82982.1 hormone conorfamide [Conus ebraeus]WMD30178.1 conorfamide precursor protein [Conus ebraeus]DAZ86340.1 TPA_inf: hormone Conorfamide [Conus ebraeus]